MGFRLALVVLALVIIMTVFVVGYCFSQPTQPEPGEGLRTPDVGQLHAQDRVT